MDKSQLEIAFTVTNQLSLIHGQLQAMTDLLLTMHSNQSGKDFETVAKEFNNAVSEAAVKSHSVLSKMIGGQDQQ